MEDQKTWQEQIADETKMMYKVYVEWQGPQEQLIDKWRFGDEEVLHKRTLIFYDETLEDIMKKIQIQRELRGPTFKVTGYKLTTFRTFKSKSLYGKSNKSTIYH